MSARDRNILLCAILGLVLAASGAQAQTTLRLGYGAAAEEPLWLLLAKPDLVKNYGKAYTLEGTRFTGSDKRAQAFEAGAIDLASGSANGVIFGAAEGVLAKMIASISRESSRGFSTTFYVKESSPIKSVTDLKGKTIGINGFMVMPNTPFGGYKTSGLGREGGRESIEAFTETKTVDVALTDSPI